MNQLETSCLSDEQFAALTSGMMLDPERSVTIDHVADCESCRLLVGDLSAQNSEMPSTIGRYEIRESLGAGGMGVVLRARDPVLQRDVALKMLHAKLAAPAYRERMLQEARALAKLSHPGIVPVFDCGVADGEVYVAMELIEGEPLHHWLHQSPRSRSARARVALGVADALIAVHQAGLLHRDIKPNNVVIRNDTPVLIDFGLARDINPSPGEPSGVAGTVQWLAPEVLGGAAATMASDQFQWWSLVELLLPHERSVATLVQRGRALDSAQRFVSMAQARARLAAVVVPRSRWFMIAALGVGGGAAALVVGLSLRSGQTSVPVAVDANSDSCTQTLVSWTPWQRVVVAGNLAAAGTNAARVMQAIDARVGAMQQLIPTACRAARNGEVAAQQIALRTYLCLQDVWHDADVVLSQMATHQYADLRRLVDEWAEIPLAAACQTSIAASPAPPPPAFAVAVSGLKDSIFTTMNAHMPATEKMAALQAMQSGIDATGYARLRGDWHGARASVAFEIGDIVAAKAELALAINDAEVAGDDDAVARLLINRLRLAAEHGERDTAALEQQAMASAGRLRNGAMAMQLLAVRAAIALSRGEGSKAVDLLRQATQAYAALTIDANAEHVMLLQNYAAVVQQIESPANAAPIYDQLVALALRRFGSDGKDYWEARGARATNYGYGGQVQLAQAELAAVVSWFTQFHPDETSILIKSYSYMCELQLGQAAFTQANLPCIEALARSEALYGADSAQIIWPLQLRARWLMANHQPLQALPVLRRALAISEHAVLSPTEDFSTRTYLAMALIALGRNAQAVPLLNQIAGAASSDPGICGFLNSSDGLPPQLLAAAKGCGATQPATP
jgi:eukaryotic-like serine/threonine-protein kinase